MCNVIHLDAYRCIEITNRHRRCTKCGDCYDPDWDYPDDDYTIADVYLHVRVPVMCEDTRGAGWYQCSCGSWLQYSDNEWDCDCY